MFGQFMTPTGGPGYGLFPVSMEPVPVKFSQATVAGDIQVFDLAGASATDPKPGGDNSIFNTVGSGIGGIATMIGENLALACVVLPDKGKTSFGAGDRGFVALAGRYTVNSSGAIIQGAPVALASVSDALATAVTGDRVLGFAVSAAVGGVVDVWFFGAGIGSVP